MEVVARVDLPEEENRNLSLLMKCLRRRNQEVVVNILKIFVCSIECKLYDDCLYGGISLMNQPTEWSPVFDS